MTADVTARRPLPRVPDALHGAGRSWLRSTGPLLVAAIFWPIYVFASSQAGFLIATAGVSLAAYDLSRKRSPALAGLLLVEIGLVGTEASGALAAGRAPLGSLHLLDCTLAAAALPQVLVRRRTVTQVWSLRHAPRSAALLAGLLAWATALWILHGAPRDSLFRADMRLAGLVVLAWISLRGLRKPEVHQTATVLVLATIVIALKSVAIYATGFWTIGTFDRLQSSTVSPTGHLRVILVGGDSWFILAPACLAALLPVLTSQRWRAALGAGIIAAFAALLLSGTRTSILVALGLLVISGVAGLSAGRHPRLTRRGTVVMVVIAIGVVAGMGGGAVATGVAQRLTSPDPSGSGLDFRRREIDSFLNLPARDLVLGQGLGGGFTGVSAVGQPVKTGWSHAFPIWLVLKTGIVGLPAWLVLATLGVRRAIRTARLASPADRALVVGGAVAVCGTLVMSLTLGRAALPEGALLIMLGWTVATVRPHEPT